MQAELEFQGTAGSWCCDLLGRPGSPVIGTGATKLDAVVALFVRMSEEEFCQFKARAQKNGIKIDGRDWRDCGGSKR